MDAPVGAARWRAYPGNGKQRRESAELRQQLSQVTIGRDVKSTRHLVTAHEVRFRAIEALAGHYPVAPMCRLLQVLRSGFYAWRQRSSRSTDCPRVTWIAGSPRIVPIGTESRT